MSITTDLRAALDAALPDLTEDQARVARTLLDALAPAMDEPKWPGAPVIAGCDSSGTRGSLHVRHNDGPDSEWEGENCCYFVKWDQLVNPRPLTPAEYEKYGIPAPCCAQDFCGVGQ